MLAQNDENMATQFIAQHSQPVIQKTEQIDGVGVLIVIVLSYCGFKGVMALLETIDKRDTKGRYYMNRDQEDRVSFTLTVIIMLIVIVSVAAIRGDI